MFVLEYRHNLLAPVQLFKHALLCPEVRFSSLANARLLCCAHQAGLDVVC